jgi:hypothetical protein
MHCRARRPRSPADPGRPPVAGLVEPARGLDLVLADRASIHVGSAYETDHASVS